MLLDGFPTAPQVEPISGLLGAHLHPGPSVPLLSELLFGRKEEALRSSQDVMMASVFIMYKGFGMIWRSRALSPEPVLKATRRSWSNEDRTCPCHRDGVVRNGILLLELVHGY